MPGPDVSGRGRLAAFRHLAALLFIIALPVALITTNIRIVMNEPRVYAYAIDHYDATETTGISRSELLRAGGELRDYFNNGSGKVSVRVQQDGETVPLFNDREVGHLEDVRNVFRATFRAQEAAIIFMLAYVVTVFIWAREGNLRSLAKQTVISGAAGIVFIAVLGVGALIGFDAVFDRFHRIFFPSGGWQFDPDTDHLIQMFPDGFWQDVSLWVGLGSVAEFALLAACAGAYLWWTREAPAPGALFEGAQAQP
jgi:integral membrane protein (TIGR01906 family)